ncbi:predicted protein [Naegleria gruberi]|uniref:Predicted protein n=1 Tax=Naegleria gruberi TaxID=5762 RepID=D2VK20_NAEGR|nr:uncharacterized protein NAEGRDRAFT_69240 [Naegleria gruberi]EFC42874.1 predicted protein [Naegleria gruberi]|eukprot:XP_002675618.1 predicted protein [Naegleria gruberi strain NEG-M]
MYVRLWLVYGTEKTKSSLNNLINNSFKRGTDQVDILKECQKLVVRLRVDNFLVGKFHHYLKNGSKFLTSRLEELLSVKQSVNGKSTKFLGDSIKDLFLISSAIDKSGGTPDYIRVVVFTPCGFPLVLQVMFEFKRQSYQVMFSYRVPLYQHSTIDYGSIIYNNHHDHWALVESLLFLENPDEHFINLGFEGNTLAFIRSLVIYGFMECAFAMNQFKLVGLHYYSLPFFYAGEYKEKGIKGEEELLTCFEKHKETIKVIHPLEDVELQYLSDANSESEDDEYD